MEAARRRSAPTTSPSWGPSTSRKPCTRPRSPRRRRASRPRARRCRRRARPATRPFARTSSISSIQQAELGLEAKKLGLTTTDAAVEKKLTAIKKLYYKGNEKRYLAGLKQQGFTDAQFRSFIREQLLETALYKSITKNAKTTKQAVDAYYAANLTQYQQPATRAVQEILVGKNKEALATQIYKQIQGGADFAALAKKYSQDPGSKDKGGKFTATKGSDVPEFDKAVFSTGAKTGVLLKPVNTSQYGWFVIKPTADITPAKTTPESKAQATIKKQLESQAQQQLASTWMQKVVEELLLGRQDRLPERLHAVARSVRDAVGVQPDDDLAP